jgi:hypothetical protein
VNLHQRCGNKMLFSTLTDLQNVVLGLPQYATEPPKWFIHREHYALIVKSQYKYAKAIRKAKTRKKRVNAKCGR